ncbi:hypothetical protein YC2023_030209 [Brassica napus]
MKYCIYHKHKHTRLLKRKKKARHIAQKRKKRRRALYLGQQVKMSSNRQRNTNSRRPTNSNQTAEDSTPPAEATLRNKDKYKWSYIQEKTLIQLFDEAVALDDYTLKNPSAIGREYMVDKFNRAFNMNITYNFFKNKLDEFKKSYKRWKTLMSFTGISVDPDTSMIYASEAWWKEREVGCKLTKSLNRKPPIFWEVMVRCFALHDVQSQSQHSARQRREELINTRLVDEEVDDGSDTDSGDRPQTQPQEMEEEEVYRVIVDDGTHHLNEDTNETVRRCHQRGRQNVQSSARRGTTSHRLGETSRVPLRGGSRGNRRRQSFETTIQDTIAGYTEFQRQSLQQLRPGAFDQENYDEWKKAEEIFLALSIPKGRFYWTCLNTLKELVFWRKYFLDIAGSIDEDKLQLLEAMTGVSRNNEDVPKQLGVDQSCGSSYSQQWGTPPTAQQWGTPPFSQQWGTPPNAQQWGTPPSVSRWGTPPNAQQWGSPQPTQQWGQPPNVQQWNTPSTSQQWGTPPNSQQWGPQPNISQWSTPPNASQCETPPNASQWGLSQNTSGWGISSNFQQGGPARTNPTTVQYGFSVGSEEESVRNAQENNAAVGTSPNDNAGHTSHTPRPGGLFNIWGTSININESHQNYSEDED